MTDMTPERAELMARSFVNGMVDEITHGERTGRRVLHTGHWDIRFQDHPWVIASEREGWGRDLRSAVMATAKRRIMGRQPYHDIDQLMPPKDIVEFWREKTARERDAAAWRDQHFVKHDSKPNEPRPLGAATRQVFRQMQRDSRNSVHLEPLAELSQIARRMGGAA